MILLLLLLQESHEIPIERYKCGANNNGYKYNVSEIAKLGSAFNFSDETDDYDYVVRLCDDLDLSQFPLGSKKRFGVNGIRINTHSHFVEPVAFHDSQDYEFAESGSPESGFVISNWAQATDPESTYRWYKFTFVFIQGEDPATEPTDHIIFADGQTLNIAITFVTSFAIPVRQLAHNASILTLLILFILMQSTSIFLI